MCCLIVLNPCQHIKGKNVKDNNYEDNIARNVVSREL